MSSAGSIDRASALRSYLSTSVARKVPLVAVAFWIVKLLTTAMGEASSDFLVFKINPYVAVIAGCLGLLIALVLQFRARRYVPWTYWLAVTMVAVWGTMAADVLHVVLGVPYAVSTGLFALALAIIFVLWYASEGTLSIHHIDTRRREVFYWATVIAAFALGTAAGDLTAATFGLGYPASAVLFAVLFLLPGLAWWKFGFNPIAAFWWAYVITRPLGASVADWLSKPFLGGLGFGDGWVALVLGLLIVVCVGYLTVSRLDTPEPGLKFGAEPAELAMAQTNLDED